MTPQQLKEWRAVLGWSQQTAADRLGVTLRTYKYFESAVTSSGRRRDVVPLYIELATRELSDGRK
jgi:DNA-binding XRE family transcriptional regulator